MITGYFLIFVISAVIFFIMTKASLFYRLSISIIFFLAFSVLFTMVIFKMVATSTKGEKYTLEQWIERNRK